jgi:AcrR family transcriptional regulator
MTAIRRRGGYHHGNLRAALIETGLKLIEEKGVKALTLREIGSCAGVSRMAAYRHFADKADLLGAISEAGFSQFADALEDARRKAPADTVSRLDAMGLAYVRFAAKHPAYYEVMFGSDARPGERQRPASEAGRRAFSILEETIQDGQRAKEIRPGSSLFLAQHVWALVHGLSTLRLDTDLRENGSGTKFALFCFEVLRTGLANRNGRARKRAKRRPVS